MILIGVLFSILLFHDFKFLSLYIYDFILIWFWYDIVAVLPHWLFTCPPYSGDDGGGHGMEREGRRELWPRIAGPGQGQAVAPGPGRQVGISRWKGPWSIPVGEGNAPLGQSCAPPSARDVCKRAWRLHREATTGCGIWIAILPIVAMVRSHCHATRLTRLHLQIHFEAKCRTVELRYLPCIFQSWHCRSLPEHNQTWSMLCSALSAATQISATQCCTSENFLGANPWGLYPFWPP